jgi:biotin carboxyl carrier protein
MTLSEVKQIISHLRSTPICELEVNEPGFSLKIKMNSTPVAMTRGGAEARSSADGLPGGPASIQAQGVFLKSPAAGQFLASHPSRPGQLAHPGKLVMSGEAVGLLKIGPLYRAVRATQPGTIVRALVEAGQTVEYGQTMFELSPR